MTTQRIAVALTLASGLAICGLAMPARAAEETHYNGYITGGAQGWDQTAPESKYQEFRAIPRAGFLSDYLWTMWSGKNTIGLWGTHFSQIDQNNRLMMASGVKWRLDIGYQQIPHLFSQIARSPYYQASPGKWTLPDTLQAKNQNTFTLPNAQSAPIYTATMTDLLNGAANIPLDFRTDVTSARLRSRPTKAWQVEARGVLRQRSGEKPYALAFSTSNAMEIPEPIRQRMIDGDVIANYQKKAFKMSLDGGVSTFENSVNVLSVDNPRRVTDVAGGNGPAAGVTDLYPDNHVIRGLLALSYQLPKRSTLTGTFGMSQGVQDDPFIAPTSNKALAQGTLDSLPRLNGVRATNLAGKVNQMNADVRLTSRPMNKLNGILRFHYVKNDNQTDALQLTGFAPADVSWQSQIYLQSSPFSNSFWTGGADVDYRLTSQLRVGGTAEYRNRERDPREFAKDHETVLGARGLWHPMNAMQIDGKYTHGDRQGDFNSEEYLGWGRRVGVPASGVYDTLVYMEQVGLRRFDVANRIEDKATAGLGYAAGERLDLSASYVYQNDDYKETTYGLTGNKDQNVTLAGTIHASDQVDLNGAYGYGWTETNQIGLQSAVNWFADLKDNDVFVQAGADWQARPNRLTLSGNYTFSRHLAEYHLTNTTNTGQDLPNTLYRLHQLVMEAKYQLRVRTSVSLRYGWEQYFTDDWATNDVPLLLVTPGNPTSSTAIFLGNSRQGYTANLLAVMMTHSF
ncbi:MAG: MtrB/PioB family decaheme-associated outer membrane protein [Candidatus Eiseniibacteriota bacterium]